MNIKILDSWLKEYLETKATAQEIAKELSLTSVSIERVEPYKNDWTYDIEITTNRPDLASVNGLAREAGAVLPQNGIKATYKPLQLKFSSSDTASGGGIEKRTGFSTSLEQDNKAKLDIQVNTKFVNRICAVVMDVQIAKSPEQIKDRLESSDIRSINNLIDITNYVMRVTGQPTHVFDYDRLGSDKLIIREAKKDEEITTLDNKTYKLLGGEIVAENAKGEIVDLLAIMGLANSVVTEKTKRIVFFVNNIDSSKVRKASMELGIRTQAAQLNEKHLDPNLCETALQYGIQLYEQLAHGKIVSQIIDIYPNKLTEKQVKVNLQKINSVIGVEVPKQQSVDILKKLGFGVESDDPRHAELVSASAVIPAQAGIQKRKSWILNQVQDDKLSVQNDNLYLLVTVPTIRAYDINLQEDIIEEIARIYGYHNLPSKLPLLNTIQTQQQGKNQYYWEQKSKNALKYWGFTEVYTYSMVPENLYEGPLDKAVTIANPLNEEFVYMRKTLVPSLLQVLSENKSFESVKIFEIANVYNKRENKLPEEVRMLAGVIRQPQISFFTVKGYVEQLLKDLGITAVSFKPTDQGGNGASIYISKQYLGEIEILDPNLINFELNFELLIKHASLKKTYIPAAKFPPILEDISLIAPAEVLTEDLIKEISKQNPLISEVTFLDRYENTRTFHVVYQDRTKNLTTEEVKHIHSAILQSLHKKWGIKEKN
ncbi:MAG TPA: phenylalanine--tRNA ligase subunit beta [Patescibacteria group bacterium]|nr:phenylalanine--tRNA ligase subunit beta [Patescibacteria group bacterium]